MMMMIMMMMMMTTMIIVVMAETRVHTFIMEGRFWCLILVINCRFCK